MIYVKKWKMDMCNVYEYEFRSTTNAFLIEPVPSCDGHRNELGFIVPDTEERVDKVRMMLDENMDPIVNKWQCVIWRDEYAK